MTKPQILILIVIIAVASLIIDNHMPLLAFRLPLTDNVTIKVIVYDRSEGFISQVFKNVKAMVDGWRGIQ